MSIHSKPTKESTLKNQTPPLCEECNRANLEFLWHEATRRYEDILNLQKTLRHKACTLTFTVIASCFTLVLQSGIELKDLTVPIGILTLVIIGLFLYIELPKLVTRGEFEIEDEVFESRLLDDWITVQFQI